MPLTYTVSAVIHIISCASSALLLAHLLQTPPLHSSTLSSQSDLITVAHSMLASQLVGWVPGPGPAFCRTPLRTHSQIWPCLLLYAGCAPLASPPAADLVSDHRFGLAVLAGPRPAYLRDLCCPTLSAPGRRSLRSTERGVLMVPFAGVTK